MERHHYCMTLALRTLAPLTHGQGTEGNVQILHRTTHALVVDDEWVEVDVPSVSGSACKAAWRSAAVDYALAYYGIEDGEVHPDTLRLLLKGGRVQAGGQSIRLDELRRLCETYPLLDVFGYMEGTTSKPGMIQVSEARVYCPELIMAGMVDDGAHDLPPISLAMAQDEITGYRHDMKHGKHGRLLHGAARAEIEDKAQLIADNKSRGRKASKDDRREVNESMPHTAQCIRPGVPLTMTARLVSASQRDFACFALALSMWRQQGGHLGGGSSRGRGSTSVRIHSATRWSSAHGPVEVDPDVTLPVQQLDGEAAMREVQEGFHAHLESVRERAVAGIRNGPEAAL